MRKILFYVSIFFLLTILLSACNVNKKASITKHPMTLRFAENHVSGYPTSLADEEFARLVEEKTEGRVKIEVITGGALTETSGETLEALKLGDIAFSRISISPIAESVPRFNALMLPYLYRSSSHMWNVLNGKIGQDLLDDVERSGLGIMALCYYDAGARNFYSTKEINSLADMKNLRIRVQNQMMVDMCEALGAVGVTGIEMTAVRSSIENGIIDAAENNWPTYQSTGDYTSAKYYVLDQHNRIPELLIASKKVLSKLDANDVKIIKECAKIAQEYEIKKWKEMESSAEQIVRSNGNRILGLSPSAQAEFQKAMKGIYEKYGSKYRDIIRTIQATR